MKFSLDTAQGYSIRAYSHGEVKVIVPPEAASPDSESPVEARLEVLTQSLIIAPGSLIRDWPPQTFAELQQEHFTTVAELEPEVVLLGSGPTQRFLSPELARPLITLGIGVECMTTAAACRTYNILAGEGRRVVAALLVDQE